MFGESQENGRDQVQVSDSIILERAQERLELEARHNHDARPIGERPVHDHKKPVYVKERQDRDHGVFLGEPSRQAVHAVELDHVRD